jgi:hypothetical protein
LHKVASGDETRLHRVADEWRVADDDRMHLGQLRLLVDYLKLGACPKGLSRTGELLELADAFARDRAA